ncbi:MAG: dihydroneopterin aldolase [Thauera sp.]|nr:dihydroneopterin aldolase [Thauera sp.]
MIPQPIPLLDPNSPMPDTASTQPHDAQALDIIFIDGFVGETVIGIHHDELHDTQPLRIDLAAGLPRSLACDTDHIGDTIDYSVVRSALHEMLADHSYRLLEAFAEGIATLLLGRFGAHWVRVRVTKPGKFHDVDGVGVMIERRRRPAPPAGARHSAEVLSLLGAGMVPGERR